MPLCVDFVLANLAQLAGRIKGGIANDRSIIREFACRKGEGSSE